jgi:hypothetical protein
MPFTLSIVPVSSVVLGSAISVYLSKREFNRQEELRHKNWNQSVHQLASRAIEPDVGLLAAKDSEGYNLDYRFDSVADKLQDRLADPYANYDPELYSSIRNLVLHLHNYVHNDASDQNDLSRMRKNAMIILYVLEEKQEVRISKEDSVEDS